MIVEYCCHGCLRQYLLTKRPFFVDTSDNVMNMKDSQNMTEPKLDAVTISDVSLDYTNDSAVFTGSSGTPASLSDVTSSPSDSNYLIPVASNAEILTTKDLICYCFQIARGMEYLTTKKVGNKYKIIAISSAI